MRIVKKILIASIFIAFSGPALAQFGDFLNKLPGNVKNLAEGAKNLVDKTKDIDEPKEIALGQEFAASLLGAKPLLNDPALQRYVNTLGRWLASQTERPDLPWTFGVLDDVGFNAFATPGGNIFVTKGLLARMRSESELAGVLAHEIAHVLRKHHLNAMKNAGGMGVITDLVASQAKFDSNLKNLAANAFKDLYAKGLDKGDEYDADRVGVVIAARAGFDPYGLPAVIQTLQSQSGQDSNFSLMFETHPSPADRLDSLDKAMRNRFESTNGSQGRPFNERFKEFSR